ncbi:histidine phosphatase family protein [Mechercharimyces sp. CAU 1602]|uniref:histidine phosphatase family protein n=1 Tax=Mechercharimyces sp. CAU 1602 TaxID=2973933 RepID=UPI0021618169|nr:histidine phosphatase family protein [Mechercharimyces sp. CAU 1602]MCS1351840.1 phosphoglycerate mutase family protein [Mechercharimyces sp. CAU 1602]
MYLIRHCQAEGQGEEAALTKVGRRQAKELANGLRSFAIKRVVSSPWERAIASITPFVENSGIELECDTRLTEWVLSTYSYSDWQDRLQRGFVAIEDSQPGGEPAVVAMKRGVAVISSLLSGKDVASAVVTHGGMLTLIVKHFFPEWGYAQWAKLDNPDVYELTWRQGHVSLRKVWGNMAGE